MEWVNLACIVSKSRIHQHAYPTHEDEALVSVVTVVAKRSNIEETLVNVLMNHSEVCPPGLMFA